jgi:hypothetical protein
VLSVRTSQKIRARLPEQELDEFAAAMGALRRDFVELADDVDAFGHDPVA